MRVLVKYSGTAVACVLAMLCLQARAAAEGCGDGDTSSVIGAVAIDGDTFRSVDGREWRLAGVLAPKRSDGARAGPAADGDAGGRSGRSRGSPADAARNALDVLVVRKGLWLTPVGDVADRYGRHLVVARDAACNTLAEGLLAAGHVRVYPTPAARSLAAALYAAESRARRERRGLWADARYRVLSASQVGGRFDSFAVIEDRALSVQATRGETVVLFGPERRRDFGVTIKPAVRKLMRAAGVDPAHLVGRQVRVRGWLHNRLGAPAIELAVPEQLEVIAP